MTPPAPPLRTALRLRARVIRRRFLSPLELVLAIGLTWLASLAGAQLAQRLPLDTLPPRIALTLALALCLTALTAAARRSLYAARDLPLLLAQGLPPRTLLHLRGAELLTLALAITLPLTGATAGALDDPSLLPQLALAWLSTSLSLTGASLLLATLLTSLHLHTPRLARLAPLTPLLILLTPLLTPTHTPLALPWNHPLLATTLPLPLAALAWALAAHRLPHHFGPALDLAQRRQHHTPHTSWTLIQLLTKPLPKPLAPLVQRDLALLLRRAFPRGLALLLALPLVLLLIRALSLQPTLRDWQLELGSLLALGTTAATAGYIIGIDFPLARAHTRILERCLPLRGTHVLRARWLLSFSYAALLTTAAAALISLHPKAFLAARASPILLKGLLLAAMATHDAAAFGLRCESSNLTTDAAAYPLRAGTLVVIFAGALTAHPLTALAYPLLGYAAAARSAARLWEHAELDPEHPANA